MALCGWTVPEGRLAHYSRRAASCEECLRLADGEDISVVPDTDEQKSVRDHQAAQWRRRCDSPRQDGR
jgi:hypothetical protein